MSRRGNCLDNSPMENFFGIMKQEMYYGIVYESFEALQHAVRELPADLVIRGGKNVNVFTGELKVGDVAGGDGAFAGRGLYEGREVIDASGKFIVAGFIGCHVRIEGWMLMPRAV